MGSEKTSTTEVDMGPWSAQQPYLKESWTEAQNLYNDSKKNPYTGDYVATFTPDQENFFKNIVDYSGGVGKDRANALYDSSNAMMTKGQSGLNDVADQYKNFANMDRVGYAINAAERNASNPYIGGMVDSAMFDAKRNAGENVLPSIYRSAAGNGNINSSRTAISEGILNRGLADKAANISADLRGQAYGQGLQLGQNDLGMMLKNIDSQGTLFGNMYQSGMAGNQQAFGQQDALTKSGAAATSALVGNNQAKLDNSLAKYNQPYENLKKYYGIVGSNNWGKTGTQTTTEESDPGLGSILGSAISGIGSLFSGGAKSSAMAGLAAFFSDERAKTDIKKLGVDDDTGLTMYAYRYKGDPKSYPKVVGPMAQEVAEKYPHAAKSINGHLTFDPGKLF